MRRKLTVPTLLLWGEKDGALGQQACTTQPRFCRCRCRWGPHHDDWVLAVCAAFISHATQAAWHHSFHATPMPCPLLPCLIPVQLLRGTERYVETLTIQVLPGCSHWVQQDQPEEVNRRMREFLPPPAASSRACRQEAWGARLAALPLPAALPAAAAASSGSAARAAHLALPCVRCTV